MPETGKTSSLNESFSLYLDLTRFIAALLVVLAHYLQHDVVTGSLAALLPSMGREAVIVFFVLSGFVIAHVTQSRVTTAREYIAARCGRIYSVALPTLMLAWLLVTLFGGDGEYQLEKPYLYIPLHLLFLGHSWNLSEVPPMLAAYWSLYYEVWYYVLFGVAYYMKGWPRTIGFILVLAIMGHKLWLLLPVWLSGVALCHVQNRISLAQATARLGLAISLSLLVIYNLAGVETMLRDLAADYWPFPAFPLGSSERFLGDYVVCVLIATNFLCARFAGLGGLRKHAGPIRAAASCTYTLYLAHMLVVLMWLELYPHDGDDLLDIAGVSIAIGFVTLALAQLTERRKAVFRQPVDWMLRQALPGKG